MKHAGGLWPLIPFLLAMIFFAGLYRLVEVAASRALAAAGMPDSGWAAVAGLAAVAAVGSILGYKWWQARRYGQYSYIRDLTGEDVALTPEQLKEIAEGREQLEQEGSPLRQVVPIGRTISADTMTDDAIALEIREAGGRMTLVVHDPVAAEEERQLQGRMSTMREPSADDWPMPLRPIVRLSDDAGTTYVTWESGAGGSGGVMRHEIGFAPTIATTATTLTIAIERLTTEPEFPMSVGKRASRIIEGPWRIEVPLRTW